MQTYNRVAIDSNSLTYLIQAMEAFYDPHKDDPSLAEERRSLLRLYLYAGHHFYVLPEVEREYRRISKKDWREVHEEVVGTLLLEVDRPLDPKRVERRRDFFLSYHSKLSDCQILGEAEVAAMTLLLTRDDRPIRRLASLTSVRMLYPSALWKESNITPGSKPMISPHPTNPLLMQTWWKL